MSPSLNDRLDMEIEHYAGAYRAADEANKELHARLEKIETLCAEHERTVNPAPYTSERALIERLRAILQSADA